MLARRLAALIVFVAAVTLAGCGGSRGSAPVASPSSSNVPVEVVEERKDPGGKYLEAWSAAFDVVNGARDRLGNPYIDTDKLLELVLPAKDEASLALWRDAVKNKEIPAVPTRYVVSPRTFDQMRDYATSVTALTDDQLPGRDKVQQAGLTWEDPRIVVEVTAVDGEMLDSLREVYGGDLVRVKVTQKDTH